MVFLSEILCQFQAFPVNRKGGETQAVSSVSTSLQEPDSESGSSTLHILTQNPIKLHSFHGVPANGIVPR